MGIEIEHKYLVKNDKYKKIAKERTSIVQGYLSRDPERTVRVRIRDQKGYLTIKGKNRGAMRAEYEYQIPQEDAQAMLALCPPPLLEKERYIVAHNGHDWEIDEFHGAKEGLVTAEIELQSTDETYSLPDFIGEEVTGNPRYYNSNL